MYESCFPLTCCLVFLTTFTIYHNLQHLMPFSNKLSSPLHTFIISTNFYLSCVKEIHVDHHQHHLSANVVTIFFCSLFVGRWWCSKLATKIPSLHVTYIVHYYIHNKNLLILFQTLDWKFGFVMDIRAPYKVFAIETHYPTTNLIWSPSQPN
jgi:hypothetical protein